ncbi:hypothetical protein OIU79_024785 [Salix purpurea]|uniref:Uncharacterized protein n=1 Tax=Salix purpurea TaxID=77065 RepID=A0A9Q1A6J2_SALPP|nr:hypothetical protein OIU79_024785 [Salix purpurea]
MKKMRLSNKWKKQDGLKDGLPHMKMMILRQSKRDCVIRERGNN